MARQIVWPGLAADTCEEKFEVFAFRLHAVDPDETTTPVCAELAEAAPLELCAVTTERTVCPTSAPTSV